MLKMKAESGEVSEEEVVKASDVILGLVDRTTKIIKGLRSYARDASKDPFEQVGVQLMVTGILDFSQSRLKKWNIQVTKEFEGKEISAFCRESEIGQVLVNLINNACDVLKDIEKRDLIIRVFSEKKTHTKEVVIQVENSGPKIPEEIQMRVFEPFFTTKAAGSGTGLGLSISSRIMQAHQGSLSLVDKDQTCFELRWPVHLE